jgi:hypothetical protein
MVAHTHLSIREAMYFLHHEFSGIEPTCNHAPTTTTEVGSKINFTHYYTIRFRKIKGETIFEALGFRDKFTLKLVH